MLALLAQLLVFVELACCARSVRIEIKDVASSVAGRLKRGDSATEKTTINCKTV